MPPNRAMCVCAVARIAQRRLQSCVTSERCTAHYRNFIYWCYGCCCCRCWRLVYKFQFVIHENTKVLCLGVEGCNGAVLLCMQLQTKSSIDSQSAPFLSCTGTSTSAVTAKTQLHFYRVYCQIRSIALNQFRYLDVSMCVCVSRVYANWYIHCLSMWLHCMQTVANITVVNKHIHRTSCVPIYSWFKIPSVRSKSNDLLHLEPLFSYHVRFGRRINMQTSTPKRWQ